jgi:hypothetical protein
MHALAFYRRTLSRLALALVALAILVAGTAGCRAISSHFTAGVWAGVIVIVVLVTAGYSVSRLVASR